ncbi:hypothetical protein CITRIK5_70348 [Citricoccus sp. K5]|nr:hypothetical protein CITRIK5_70348 [Citricoccus sp. K5]
MTAEAGTTAVSAPWSYSSSPVSPSRTAAETEPSCTVSASSSTGSKTSGSGLGTNSGVRSGKSRNSVRVAAADAAASGSAVLEGSAAVGDGAALEGWPGWEEPACVVLVAVVTLVPLLEDAPVAVPEDAGTGITVQPASSVAAATPSAARAAAAVRAVKEAGLPARAGRRGAGRSVTVGLSWWGAGYP